MFKNFKALVNLSEMIVLLVPLFNLLRNANLFAHRIEHNSSKDFKLLHGVRRGGLCLVF